MGDYIGLKFLFCGGHFIIAVVSRRDAEDIVRRWKGVVDNDDRDDDEYDLDSDDDDRFVGGWDLVTPYGTSSWFVYLDEVQAIHTENLPPPGQGRTTNASGVPIQTPAYPYQHPNNPMYRG